MKNTYTYSPSLQQNLFFFGKKTIEKRRSGCFLYELDNWLGNVQVVVSDKKFGVDSTGDGVVDYYRADVVNVYDYYSGVGQLMPGRVYERDSYRFGAQGSEIDTAVGSDRNTITTFYREGNLETGQWWSLDPVTNASESPYRMMGNPIRNNDPLGDCEDCKVEAKAAMSFNFGTKGKGSFSIGLGVGASVGGSESGARLSLNTSLRLYGGGLGSKGMKDPQLDIVASPAYTIGGGAGKPSTLATFNANNIDAVTSTDKYSFTLASNFVYNVGRENFSSFQRVGNLSVKAGNFSANIYNDFARNPLAVFFSDGDDRMWTGGGKATIDFGGGTSMTLGTEVFTGERSSAKGGEYNRNFNANGDGFDYYRMKAGQGKYTDGQTFLRLTNNNFTVNASLSGYGRINSMWSQNLIHAGFGSPRFSNENQPQSIQIGGSYNSGF